MARKSYEAQARELAAQKNVELSVDVDNGEDFEVELWGGNTHMSFDDCHTSIISFAGWGFTTKAQVWKKILEDLDRFEPCEIDCNCYGAEDE